MLYFAAAMFGFSVSTSGLGGMIPLSNMSTDFRTPASPLAPSRWPILALTDPLVSGKSELQSLKMNYVQVFTYTYKGSSAERCAPNARPIAFTSIGSPTAVPVPVESISQGASLHCG